MDATDRQRGLARLYAAIQTDPLSQGEGMGSVFVPGVGPLGGGVPVLVGEAPGREEERRREPFVGAAGRNLNGLLDGCGWSRDGVFITNLLKYRPVNTSGANRSPTLSEGRHALGYLLEELTLLEPQFVVCLGLSAARVLLGDGGLRMEKANGAWFVSHGFRITVTYHPSPLNFNVPFKREALIRAFQRFNNRPLK